MIACEKQDEFEIYNQDRYDVELYIKHQHNDFCKGCDKCNKQFDKNTWFDRIQVVEHKDTTIRVFCSKKHLKEFYTTPQASTCNDLYNDSEKEK